MQREIAHIVRLSGYTLLVAPLHISLMYHLPFVRATETEVDAASSGLAVGILAVVVLLLRLWLYTPHERRRRLRRLTMGFRTLWEPSRAHNAEPRVSEMHVPEECVVPPSSCEHAYCCGHFTVHEYEGRYNFFCVDEFVRSLATVTSTNTCYFVVEDYTPEDGDAHGQDCHCRYCIVHALHVYHNTHCVTSSLNGNNGEATNSDDHPQTRTQYTAGVDDLVGVCRRAWPDVGVTVEPHGLRVTRVESSRELREPSDGVNLNTIPAELSRQRRLLGALRERFADVQARARIERRTMPPTSQVGDRLASTSGVDAGLAQVQNVDSTLRRPRSRERQRRNRRENRAARISPIAPCGPADLETSSAPPEEPVTATEVPDGTTNLPVPEPGADALVVPLYETKVRVLDLVRGRGRLVFPSFNRSEEAPYALGYRYSSDVIVKGSEYSELLTECQGMRVASDYSIDNIRRTAATKGYEEVVLPRLVHQRFQFQRLEDNRYGCSASVVPLGSLNCLAPVSGMLVGSASMTKIASTLGILSLMVYSGGSIGRALQRCGLGFFRVYKLLNAGRSQPGHTGPFSAHVLRTAAQCIALTAIISHWQQIACFMTRSAWVLYMRAKLESSTRHLRSVLVRIFRDESGMRY